MRRLVFLIVIVVALASVVLARKVKLKKAKNCQIPCPRNLQPVCGSNGTTYSNKCEFRRAKCLATKNGVKLLIQYEGKCGNPKQISTNKPKRITPTKNRKPSRNGKRACPETTSRCKRLNSMRNAVCGSNNVTYHTFCHFRIAKCHAALRGQLVTVQYKGVCGKPKRQLVCPQVSQCHNRNSPICGNNGQTYRNLCHFLVAKCNARKDRRRKIKLRYRGRCGSPTTPKPCPRRCPKSNKPVCGSDGNTYRNGCMLASVKCALPKGEKRKLSVSYRGPCGSPSTPKPCLTIRKCRHKRSPVCGTDGVTYSSKCHLRVEKCKAKRNKRSPIALKHTGNCKQLENGVGQ